MKVAQIIEGIRLHDRKVLNRIYRENFPQIEKFVLNNQGSSDHARDVFQEAMIVVYRNICTRDLELSCKFGTYLYSICKNIWLQERKKQMLRAEKLRSGAAMLVREPEPERDFLMEEHRKSLFQKHFARISPDCQKILMMYFSSYRIDEIRKEMGYRDHHHTSDRKYRCMNSLMKRMMNDPLFKRLNDEQS